MSEQEFIDDAAEQESPSTELANVMSEGDPEVALAILEKRAQLAPRFKAARDIILASQTYAEDWKAFGDKVCLSSAGSERVGMNFPIRFHETSWRKETFTDANGKGYRYVYEGYATMVDRTVFAQGIYGTRDEFLGKAHDEWKAIEEINERSIQNAAYHVFQGNAIKALLGLRGIPKAEFEKIMALAGRDAKKAGSSVPFGSGTKGGTSGDDTAMQKELAEICIALANAGKIVKASADYKTFTLDDAWDGAYPMETAKTSCVELSTFVGKEGKTIPGKGAKDLKGQSLQITLQKARTLKGQLGGGQ
jgi:hypothetical protein